MKKLFLVFAMLMMSLTFAQTGAGSSFVGLNSTGLNFATVQDSGVKNYNVGVQAGHFVVDKLAVVAGVGYNATRVKNVGTTNEDLTYLGGFKYYVENVLPVQLDYNGVDKDNYLGTQLGYAFFPAKNFSVEPTIRYDIALKDNNG